MKRFVLFSLVHVIIAIYLINFAVGFIEMPDFVTVVDRWVILIGGALLFIRGITFLKTKKQRMI